MQKPMSLLALLLVLVAGLFYFTAPIQADNNTITVEQAKEQIAAGALLLDVRSAEEFASGHLPGAINIIHSEIDKQVAQLGEDKKRTIVLYCKSGKRAGVATEKLRSLGWFNAYNAGGIGGLK